MRTFSIAYVFFLLSCSGKIGMIGKKVSADFSLFDNFPFLGTLHFCGSCAGLLGKSRSIFDEITGWKNAGVLWGAG